MSHQRHERSGSPGKAPLIQHRKNPYSKDCLGNIRDVIRKFGNLNSGSATDGTPLSSMKGHSVYVGSHDFDNAFTYIQHEDVVHAWKLLHQFIAASGKEVCWVNINKRNNLPTDSVPQHATWTKPEGKAWIKVSLDQVAACINFLLSNSWFTLAGKKGRQLNGLAMGISHASSFCTMVFTIYEFIARTSPSHIDFMKNLSKQRIFIDAFRYVDDLRIFAIFPRHVSRESIMHTCARFIKTVWHNVSPLKADNVNATIGLYLWFDQNRFRWLPSSKDFASLPTGTTNARQSRGTPSFQNFKTHCTPAQHKGALASHLHCAISLASDHDMKVDSLTLTCIYLMEHCEYPVDHLRTNLAPWMKIHFSHPTYKCHDLASDILERASDFINTKEWTFRFPQKDVSKSFNSPNMCWDIP